MQFKLLSNSNSSVIYLSSSWYSRQQCCYFTKQITEYIQCSLQPFIYSDFCKSPQLSFPLCKMVKEDYRRSRLSGEEVELKQAVAAQRTEHHKHWGELPKTNRYFGKKNYRQRSTTFIVIYCPIIPHYITDCWGEGSESVPSECVKHFCSYTDTQWSLDKLSPL